jgi:transcriptional regulator with XRE-family HTH domain
MSDTLHIGKRIRFLRERRGLTQKQLGELAGLIEATVRKYEIGQRNPKPDQIKLIADALGVTPNALSPVEIETDADIISLILAIDKRIGITFDGKKNNKGHIDPKTLTLHIDDLFVNDALARYGSGKNYLSKLQAQDVPKKDKAEHEKIIEEFEEDLKKVKLSLLDSSKVIDNNQDGNVVKTPPDLPMHFKLPPKD